MNSDNCFELKEGNNKSTKFYSTILNIMRMRKAIICKLLPFIHRAIQLADSVKTRPEAVQSSAKVKARSTQISEVDEKYWPCYS